MFICEATESSAAVVGSRLSEHLESGAFQPVHEAGVGDIEILLDGKGGAVVLDHEVVDIARRAAGRRVRGRRRAIDVNAPVHRRSHGRLGEEMAADSHQREGNEDH